MKKENEREEGRRRMKAKDRRREDGRNRKVEAREKSVEWRMERKEEAEATEKRKYGPSSTEFRRRFAFFVVLGLTVRHIQNQLKK